VIDRYAGDGIKADFGIPVPRDTEEDIRRDALNAVLCALDMKEEMFRLRGLLESKKLPPTAMRIGIATGPAIAGVIGSAERMQYTTLGDSVNLAARLESYDKDFENEDTCRILISKETMDHIGDRFNTLEVGEVNLKGFQQKVKIFLVTGLKDVSKHIEKG
jgi:adenylate cyclase